MPKDIFRGGKICSSLAARKKKKQYYLEGNTNLSDSKMSGEIGEMLFKNTNLQVVDK